MAGFNNTPPASEFRRPASWGRTRRPKNLKGATSTAQVDCGQGAGNEGADPTTSAHGFPTENQRFLHVVLKEVGNNNVPTLTLWAYSHASGNWGLLKASDGSAITIAGAGDSTVYRIIEVFGVDRVYFQQTGGNFTTATDELYAACSTF